MDSSTDNEIINDVLAGRKESFTFLVKRYQGQAYRLSLAILRNPTDAEDAVSEAFCKSYGALDRCRNQVNFKSWFLKITYNCCQDILRRRNRETPNADIPEELARESQQNPIEDLICREKKNEIWQALGRLETEDLTAMVLKYYHNASYREIAAVLNWPEGTVASRLYRSREKMRQYLLGGVKI